MYQNFFDQVLSGSDLTIWQCLSVDIIWNHLLLAVTIFMGVEITILMLVLIRSLEFVVITSSCVTNDLSFLSQIDDIPIQPWYKLLLLLLPVFGLHVCGWFCYENFKGILNSYG